MGKSSSVGVSVPDSVKAGTIVYVQVGTPWGIVARESWTSIISKLFGMKMLVNQSVGEVLKPEPSMEPDSLVPKTAEQASSNLGHYHCHGCLR